MRRQHAFQTLYPHRKHSHGHAFPLPLPCGNFSVLPLGNVLPHGLCPDSTQVELFFSEEDAQNEILDRRSLPAGGYAWNMEDDDTKNVRLENGKWTVGRRGKLIYKQVADK